MFANAARGKTAAFDAETYEYWGGGVGLGFGNAYLDFPGAWIALPIFCHPATVNGKLACRWQTASSRPLEEFADDFRAGERYVKNPDLVKQWIDELPINDPESRYVLFKPLAQIDLARETPETVVFVANPDQLSALVILANYARSGMENVSIPWAAGCQTIGLLPFNENKSKNPRAVVGLTDISARKYVRKLLGAEYLSFAMPWSLFLEMEDNVEGSFLQRPTWISLKSSAK
ncbi:MAG: DUF169 domain-containing protein [Desulfobacterales bacterium]